MKSSSLGGRVGEGLGVDVRGLDFCSSGFEATV